MSSTTAGIIFVVTLIIALAATYRPLGDYMARMYSGGRHLRAEKAIYRVTGINPDAEQSWGSYLRSVLAFSGVSVVFLYVFLRIQQHIGIGHAYAVPKMGSSQAFNTAASFVTNTNWQSYSGENALGYVVQATGLAVQNFASAAVGIAVAITLVRGFVRRRTGELGNFWVDLTRTCIRLLLPVSFLFAIVFIAGGAVQNWHSYLHVTTLTGGSQTHHRRSGRQPGGHQTVRHQRRRLPECQLRDAHGRTRRSGRTGCRSTCCWPSASRCHARSERWSEMSGRAGRSSR